MKLVVGRKSVSTQNPNQNKSGFEVGKALTDAISRAGTKWDIGIVMPLCNVFRKKVVRVISIVLRVDLEF